MAFLVFGVVLWVVVAKFLGTVMLWTGMEEYDFQLLGDQFKFNYSYWICYSVKPWRLGVSTPYAVNAFGRGGGGTQKSYLANQS